MMQRHVIALRSIRLVVMLLACLHVNSACSGGGESSDADADADADLREVQESNPGDTAEEIPGDLPRDEASGDDEESADDEAFDGDAAPEGDECVPYDGVCAEGCDPATDHDCLPAFSGHVIAAKNAEDYDSRVYIDPSWTGCEEGTMACPYNSWTDVSWAPGIAYLQKRGTTETLSGELLIMDAPNVYIGSYGTGPRPVMIGGASALLHVQSEGVFIRDIHLQNPAASRENSGQVVYFRGNGGNGVIYDCTISNSSWEGIFSWASGLKVLYSEVYDINQDGIWIGNSEYFEIAHNTIHDVNQAWNDYGADQDMASGDVIQLEEGINNWWIHHNEMDRTNSGNKFCTHSASTLQTFGLFEYNTLRGPMTDGEGGASVYLESGSGITIRNNQILGPSPSGFYAFDTDNVLLEGNTFDGVTNAIENYDGAGLIIRGNTFLNILGECFQGIYELEEGNTGDCF
jgi:parallel beta-helix repeat protein